MRIYRLDLQFWVGLISIEIYLDCNFLCFYSLVLFEADDILVKVVEMCVATACRIFSFHMLIFLTRMRGYDPTALY